jgi:hypothetical protein
VTIAQADLWLEDREPVLVVEAGGRTRAYPHQILIWHEIANDVLGGRPIAVTYCPLCNAALVFDRRVEGQGTLTFGTTGNSPAKPSSETSPAPACAASPRRR